MMQAADAATPQGRDLGIVAALPPTAWIVVLLLPLVALKAAQTLLAAPTADEAYYWLWGQHLALSYYDHPPLTAWLQRLAAEAFGWNLFALRATTLASFAGCLAILWYWSKRLAGPQDTPRAFLAGVVAWLSIPMLMRFQSVAHQDHLLVFFGMACAHCWALFVESLDGDRRAWRWFYAGCAMLGLAGLTKYNAVFIGLGFAVWVLVSAKGRPLLASVHLWLGAALAVAMQAPVVAWNVMNDWPSFRFNLEGRIGEQLHDGFAGNLASFAFMSAIMLSPAMVLALVRFVTGTGGVRTPFAPVGRWVFAVSTLAFVALCVSNTILYYWNIVACIFLLPVAVFYLRSRLEFGIHAVYGILIGVWIVALQAIYPSYKLGNEAREIRDNDISYGLEEIAAIVAEEETRLKPDMVLTNDYRTAALLSFTARRLDIANIGPRRGQFDFWFDPAAHKGEDALVLVDDFLPEDRGVTQAFATVTPVREFTIERFGFPMHSYRLVYGQGYSGELAR